MADDKTTEEPQVPEDNKEESPVDESKVEEQSAPSEAPAEEETTPEPEAEKPEEEEKPPSRREQLRVQQLLKRYGPPNTTAPSQGKPDFRDKVNADEEVYKTLEDTATQYGNDQFNAGQSQAEYSTWRRFLQMDETSLQSKYPELNPNKETHHPALQSALQEKYLRFVGFNPGDSARGIAPSVQDPDISYSDFVEAEMEFADEIASQKTARTTQNLAKQAASTGLRPDGSSAKRLDLNKSPEDMTDEELETMVSATMPRDSKGRFTPQNK